MCQLRGKLNTICLFRLKDLPTSILILLRNPAFLLVASANALDFGLISGLSAFTPKYLESMFGLTPSVAAYYLGKELVWI